MDNKECQHLEMLLGTHQRRLRILEQQAAGYGALAVPTHVVIELEDLKEKITEIEGKLAITTSRSMGSPNSAEKPIVVDKRANTEPPKLVSSDPFARYEYGLRHLLGQLQQG